MRLAAPREASSTHISGFQSASSQLRALRWGAGGRAKEAKAWAGAGLQQGKDPQHKFSLSLTGAGGRGRKLWQISRKPLGELHLNSHPPPAWCSQLELDWERRERPGLGAYPFHPKLRRSRTQKSGLQAACDSSSISFQIPPTALTPRPGSPQASPQPS